MEKIDFSKLATKEDLKSEVNSIRAEMATKEDMEVVRGEFQGSIAIVNARLDHMEKGQLNDREEWLAFKNFSYDRFDDIMGFIKEYREDKVIQKGHITGNTEQLQNHEIRISNLERAYA